MVANTAAAQRSVREARRRSSSWRGMVVYCLAVGAGATVTAAAFSLLVESILAKRVVWLTVTVGVSVGAGIWRSFATPTEHQHEADHGPLPDRRAEFHR